VRRPDAKAGPARRTSADPGGRTRVPGAIATRTLAALRSFFRARGP
jgi:hypothetical protein